MAREVATMLWHPSDLTCINPYHKSRFQWWSRSAMQIAGRVPREGKARSYWQAEARRRVWRHRSLSGSCRDKHDFQHRIESWRWEQGKPTVTCNKTDNWQLMRVQLALKLLHNVNGGDDVVNERCSGRVRWGATSTYLLEACAGTEAWGLRSAKTRPRVLDVIWGIKPKQPIKKVQKSQMLKFITKPRKY